MMRLVIGNRAYSSWSLRGWLAAKQSGLPFDLRVVPMFGPDWAETRRRDPDLAPSAGKVPVLWDGDLNDGGAVVWDSLAIMDYLADKVGRERFWPRDPAARGLARAMVAEMHAGFAALREACTMNVRRHIEYSPDDAVAADVVRILTLWAEARARFGGGGPFLFGCFGAADIAFAPVVTRIETYGIAMPGFAQAYVDAVLEHPWVAEWIAAAHAEPWTVDRYEIG